MHKCSRVANVQFRIARIVNVVEIVLLVYQIWHEQTFLVVVNGMDSFSLYNYSLCSCI